MEKILKSLKSYIKNVYPNGLSSEQYTEVKRAYYAGIIEMYTNKKKFAAIKDALDFWEKQIKTIQNESRNKESKS
jgi:hypothetical protein